MLYTTSQGIETVVDDEDYERLLAFGAWYAVRKASGLYIRKNKKDATGAHRVYYLHRWLLNAPQGVTVDHINGVTLDNRKANLRLATVRENARNTCLRQSNKSGFRGVYQDKRTGKWHAALRTETGREYLCGFESAAQAYEAWIERAKSVYGAEWIYRTLAQKMPTETMSE